VDIIYCDCYYTIALKREVNISTTIIPRGRLTRRLKTCLGIYKGVSETFIE